MPSFSRKSHRRAWTYALVGLLAVASVGTAFIAVRSVSPDTSAQGQSPSGGLDDDPSTSTLAFLGEDISGPEEDAAWSAIVADEFDWRLEDLSASGAGFAVRAEGEACASSFCPSILDAVPLAVAANASAVVVAASAADASAPVDELRSRMETVFTALRAGLPEAVILAVGPASIDPPSAEALVVDGALRAAAADAGVEYVSLVTPALLSPERIVDGVVDAEGSAAIAQRVIAALRS